MGEPGFRVHPDALTRYATVIDAQREEISYVRSKLAAVSVPSDAFGHLPDAQLLYQAYHEHAEAEQQNLADLLEALKATVHGLTISAEAYRDHEHQLESGFGGGR